MKINKAFAMGLLFTLFPGHFLWAAEKPQVTLEKKEGRTEAVVSAEAQEVREAPKGFLGNRFFRFENGVMDTAAAASRAVGGATEVIVKGIGTASRFAFSPFFRAVDLKNHFEKKQDVNAKVKA